MRDFIRRASLWFPTTARRLWRETDGGWYGPSGSCSCCETCSIFSDDFNRADDTDLGADWSEVSGSWAITSNTLRTSSTSALCIHDNGTGAAGMSLSVQAQGTSGDFVRLIGGYQDTSNYWFAEMKVGASGTGRFDLFRRSAGSNTLVQGGTLTVPASAMHTITLCIQDPSDDVALPTVFAKLVLNAGGGASRWGIHTLTTADGSGVGTGTTASSTVAFDAFSATKTDGSCPKCQLLCATCTGDGFPPVAYDITLPTLTNAAVFPCGSSKCAVWSGQTYRVYQCGNCAWVGDVDSCVQNSVTRQYYLRLCVEVGGSLSKVQLVSAAESYLSGRCSPSCDMSGEGSGSVFFVQWELDSVGDFDCFDVNSFDFELIDGTPGCTAVGTTVTVTPVV